MIISVVIPSYNHKKYVIQAIESVLDQSWPRVDLIVIDDGSTDGSPEVIQKLLEKRGGFRFVPRENRGLLTTLNEGLALARGDFFCELASDDYFPPDSLEIRANFLLEHSEYVAVFGDGIIVRREELSDDTFDIDKTRLVLEKADPIPDMLKGVKPVFSTCLVRTDLLRRAGGFDEGTFRYYEDLDTPVRLALAGKLGCIEEPVIFRREHGANVSSVTSHIREEKVLLYSKLMQNPGMTPYRRLLKVCLRRALLALGRHLNKTGGGTPRERKIFRSGWPLGWRDPRLLWYLLKFGR